MFFACFATLPLLHSFPTRRSSDLRQCARQRQLLAHAATAPLSRAVARQRGGGHGYSREHQGSAGDALGNTRDRNSTRLNSTHPSTSYDVICLNKKNSS